MAQWSKLLKSLGFTESESKIYLLALEMGPSPVQKIAQRANVSRVTTYAAIESLTGHGLMTSVQKGKKTMYAAEAPERLTSYVRSRLSSMESTLKDVETSLDDLKLLQRGEKPLVKLYEGHDAFRAIQEDVLATKPKELIEFGNLDDIRATYPDSSHFEPFFKQLSQLKTQRRAAFATTAKDFIDKSPNLEMMTLPSGHDFHGDFVICGNKVAFSTFRGKQISVLIESQDIADTLKALFDMYWKHAKK